MSYQEKINKTITAQTEQNTHEGFEDNKNQKNVLLKHSCSGCMGCMNVPVIRR